MEMTRRLLDRSRRLYEQGVDEHRLRQQVQRWFMWLQSGLRNRVVYSPPRIARLILFVT